MIGLPADGGQLDNLPDALRASRLDQGQVVLGDRACGARSGQQEDAVHAGDRAMERFSAFEVGLHDIDQSAIRKTKTGRFSRHRPNPSAPDGQETQNLAPDGASRTSNQDHGTIVAATGRGLQEIPAHRCGVGPQEAPPQTTNLELWSWWTGSWHCPRLPARGSNG